jgi:hypothetical protein
MNGVTRSLVSVIVLLSAIGSASARELVATSGKEHVQLVELFSSESCSSCPPADQYASSLKSRTGLWTRFVPIVFHVDYWNHLDWKDGYSSDAMTRRQQQLASTWLQPAVYTPAFVVDGKEWRSWRSKPTPETTKGEAFKLSVYKTDAGHVEVVAEGLPKSSGFEIFFAELGMGLVTKVSSGENSGKTLTHDFLVLNWDHKELTTKSTSATFSIGAKPSTGAKENRRAVVAWIQRSGNPQPVQAVGGYL